MSRPKKSTEAKSGTKTTVKATYAESETKFKKLLLQYELLKKDFNFNKVKEELTIDDESMVAMLTEENRKLNQRLQDLESGAANNTIAQNSSSPADKPNKQTENDNDRMTNGAPGLQRQRTETAKMDAITTENEKLKKRLHDELSKISKFEETEKHLQEQLAATNVEIAKLKTDLKSAQEKGDQMKKQDKGESQISGKSDSDIEKRLNEATEMVERLKSDLKEQTETVNTLKEDKCQLEKQLTEAKENQSIKKESEANQTEVKDAETKTTTDQDLKTKELQLKSDEHALKKREEVVKSNEDALEKREEVLKCNEDSLKRRADGWNAKENVLQKREDDLRDKQTQFENTRAEAIKKENEVKDRESELRRQGDELQKKTNELENKQRTLTQSEIKLEEKEKDIANKNNAKNTPTKAEFNDLEADLKDKESEIVKLNKKLSEKDRDVEDLKTKISKLEKTRGGNNTSPSAMSYKRELEKANTEIEELKTRLSKVVGAQITDGNPDIADLSDLNRPTKLAEKYAELYDNEWTDAYEEIEGSAMGEVEVIQRLLKILKEVYKFCQEVSKDYEKGIKTSALVIPGSDKGRPKTPQLSATSRKQIVELRKTFAPTLTEDVFKQYLKTLKQSVDKSPKTKLFMKTCIDICWLMSIQDPPVVLDTVDPKGPFDGDRYRTYTRSGKTFDYVVWPPMRLHEAGALLGKGVAQAK